jgi:hypothetical protein
MHPVSAVSEPTQAKQWELFDRAYVVEPIVTPDYGGATIDERFRAFHKANPHVYRVIVKIARELKASGLKVCGMRLIFCRLRWLYAIRTQGDPFKLNDHYVALYSRKVMNENEDLTGFFRCRVRRAKGASS